jgi:myo-inositol-1(or 4)-monophosphatase
MSESDLALAIDAARAAGRLALEHWQRALDVRHKAADQPVTAADIAVDRLLRARFADARPDDGWLSEESRDAPARLERGRVWVVDPIDGTRSYIARRPEFTISIALVVAGAPVVGVVCNPATDELYHAVRGGGAAKEQGGTNAPLRVRPAPARPLLVASRSEVAAGELEPFGDDWDIAVVGSTAYKLARVAAGEADGYLSRGAKSEWDVAAGVLLVQEAGGRATELDGTPARFNRPLPVLRGIVAAGDVYDRLSAIAGALPPLDRLRERPADALHPGLEGRDT